MLSAPPHSGKERLAIAAFASMNCSGEKGLGGEACGRCNSCTMLAAGRHPDLLIVRPPDRTKDGKEAKNPLIRIEQITPRAHEGGHSAVSVSSFCETGPTFKRKGVIIAGRLNNENKEAANALLKLLEEPPFNTCFFLLVSGADDTLPTLTSRCLRLGLPPLSEAEMRQLGPTAGEELLQFAAGRLGVLDRAAAVEEVLSQAKSLQAALCSDLLSALDAAKAYDDEWSEWHAPALRHVWRELPLTLRAALEAELQQLIADRARYVSPTARTARFCLQARLLLGVAE